MASLLIVEHKDPIKKGKCGLSTTLIDMSTHVFSLEQTKEVLHHRIIMAVAFATHAHLNMKLSKHRLIRLIGLLDDVLAPTL